MTSGLSLHFAVPLPADCCTKNRLGGPVGNANEMARIAGDAGFRVLGPFIGAGVTRARVLRYLLEAVGDVRSGDILLVTFSGHGCQAMDQISPPNVGGFDESWCLADGQLHDTQLHGAWAKFDKGVRIVVVSESCHSEGMGSFDKAGRVHPATPEELESWEEYRRLVIAARQERWGLVEGMEDMIVPRRADRVAIQASGILLAACRDREKAQDLSPTSRFTRALLKELDKVPPHENYQSFIHGIHDRVAKQNPKQHPGIVLFGERDPDFPKQRPFTI